MFWLLLCLTTTQALYTNRQALQCFQQKALARCQEYFDICTSYQCREELQKYSKCTFGSSQTEQQHIFNGNCFKKWRTNAHQTRKVIECLVQTCDFEYNSQIDLMELFRCSEWIMLQDNIQCDDSCLQQMGTKIRDNFYSTKIVDLFTQSFNNSQAQQLTELIKKQCIDNGRGRQMLENEQRFIAQQEEKEKNQEKDDSPEQL